MENVIVNYIRLEPQATRSRLLLFLEMLNLKEGDPNYDDVVEKMKRIRDTPIFIKELKDFVFVMRSSVYDLIPVKDVLNRLK